MLNNHNKMMHTNLFFNKHNRIDYALISPMPEELLYFQKVLRNAKCTTVRIHEFEFKVYEYNQARILVAHTGLGTTFSAIALTLIQQHFHPDYIISMGTAGGLKENIRIKDVVIVTQAFEAEIQDAFILLKNTPFEGCLRHPFKKQHFPSTYNADPELLDICNSLDTHGYTVHKDKVVSSNTFPAPVDLIHRIKEQGACAIDMETSAFYQTAWLLDAKVITIRGISNVLNSDGTDDNVHISDVEGSSHAAGEIVLRLLNKLIEKKFNKKLSLSSDNTLTNETKKIITNLNLQAHPEGGYFAQFYKSNDLIKPCDKNRYQDENRSAGTSIYYLLNQHDFSAWHKLKSDEIWHYYKGSAVKLYVINAEGKLSMNILGDPFMAENASFQVLIKAGDWFAAENIDKSTYSLVGCTVSPGFEYNDFHLANRKDLVAEFPQHEKIINQFTRAMSSDNEISQYKFNKKMALC